MHGAFKKHYSELQVVITLTYLSDFFHFKVIIHNHFYDLILVLGIKRWTCINLYTFQMHVPTYLLVLEIVVIDLVVVSDKKVHIMISQCNFCLAS